MSIATHPELYKRPTFNQALVEKFTPMICLMIKKNVHGYNSSDICFDWEDMFQECLMHLNEAVIKFDESKGMKFSNFTYMVLKCRLGNFRTKHSKHNFKTTNFSSLPNNWKNPEAEFDADFFEPLLNGSDALFNCEEIQNQIMDAKLVYDRLKGDRKMIYQDYYIAGKSVQEICNENDHLEYYQVRTAIKHLNKIHATLVEGDTQCLQ